MTKYSKKELIKIIKDYAVLVSRTPKMEEISKNKNLPSINQFLKNVYSKEQRVLK